MALVVHANIVVEKRKFSRGDVLFGPDADAAAANPLVARFCAPVPDAIFAEPAKPKPLPPKVDAPL